VARSANSPDEGDPLITTGQAARLLNVDPGTIRRYIRLGDLEAARLPSGVYRIRRSAVLRLLERAPQGE
jgi:excisionase family DNA binding protein